MRPTQETIDAFTSITGASDSVALQKLEEYGGNLNEAVNAYFTEGHRDITNPTAVASSRLSNVEMTNNNNNPAGPSRLSQLFNAARSFRLSSMLNPNYRRGLLNELGASALTTRPPLVSPTGGMTGVPPEFNGWNEQPYHPGMPYGYYGSSNSSDHGLGNQDNLLRSDHSHFHGNDIEEQMVQAAIKASKREESSGSGPVQSQIDLSEDDEFSRAISLSMKTAEQEKKMREQSMKNQDQLWEVYGLGTETEKTNSSTRKVYSGNSSVQEGDEDIQARSSLSYKSDRDIDVRTQRNKDAFPANEWGGISPKELDDAIMLEATLFGDADTGCSDHLPSGVVKNAGRSSSAGSHASPSSVMAQLSLKEQQDDEYLASLLRDREKEMHSQKEAESLSLRTDESHKKILEEEKLEKWLSAKENSLPLEPAEDENAVFLLVKMPDGSRRGRRFLKSDRLQVLFDFVDIGRVVKPGTYRVVRPFPRRAFNVSDGSSSFNELGLTSKQEVLFLEFI